MQVQLVNSLTTVPAFLATSRNIQETLSRLQNTATTQPPVDQIAAASLVQHLPCLELPIKMYSSFFERVETFAKMDQLFCFDRTEASFRSVTLHGLGGVGKSSNAAGYIEQKVEEKAYDAMFWIHCQTTAFLRQSFTDISLLLELPGAHPNLHDENLIQVQRWFQSTSE
nr:hypothetical protein CFP56_63557 [Quercus suber]